MKTSFLQGLPGGRENCGYESDSPTHITIAQPELGAGPVCSPGHVAGHVYSVASASGSGTADDSGNGRSWAEDKEEGELDEDNDQVMGERKGRKEGSASGGASAASQVTESQQASTATTEFIFPPTNLTPEQKYHIREQGEQPLHQWAGLGLGDRHPSRARHSSQARGSTEMKIVNSELNTFQELWKC